MHDRTRPQGRTPARARALSVAAGLLLLAVFTPVPRAGAVSKAQVESAKRRVQAIQTEIEAQQKEVDRLQQKSSALALRVSEAVGRLQVTTGRLVETRARLEKATAEYNARVQTLEDRAREAFVAGGVGNLEFLLSAESLSDLSDRIEFVDQVSAADAEIAAQVQGLRNLLQDDKRALEKLQAQQQSAVDELQVAQAALDEQLAAQQDRLDRIEALKKQRQAVYEQLDKRLQRQIKRRLAALGGSAPIVSNGVFKVCPVGQPRSFGDDFGAPRYTGGYHPHAGNDIIAPLGTPIYAPFDGVATDSSNTLGGIAVNVSGADGYVYNAHMSRLGKLGPVKAGDVVGYVGNSGDASGGVMHDHFQWQPKVTPNSWPTSSYGYSVIGKAVNPYPILTQVC